MDVFGADGQAVLQEGVLVAAQALPVDVQVELFQGKSGDPGTALFDKVGGGLVSPPVIVHGDGRYAGLVNDAVKQDHGRHFFQGFQVLELGRLPCVRHEDAVHLSPQQRGDIV